MSGKLPLKVEKGNDVFIGITEKSKLQLIVKMLGFNI